MKNFVGWLCIAAFCFMVAMLVRCTQI